MMQHVKRDRRALWAAAQLLAWAAIVAVMLALVACEDTDNDREPRPRIAVATDDEPVCRCGERPVLERK